MGWEFDSLSRSVSIPKSVKVGTITYEIVSDDKEQFSDRGYEFAYGETICKDQKIILHPENASGIQKITLFHEIFHCVLDGTPLMLSSEEEERIIRALDSGLLNVLQQNPLVSNYLMGHEHA